MEMSSAAIFLVAAMACTVPSMVESCTSQELTACSNVDSPDNTMDCEAFDNFKKCMLELVDTCPANQREAFQHMVEMQIGQFSSLCEGGMGGGPGAASNKPGCALEDIKKCSDKMGQPGGDSKAAQRKYCKSMRDAKKCLEAMPKDCGDMINKMVSTQIRGLETNMATCKLIEGGSRQRSEGKSKGKPVKGEGKGYINVDDGEESTTPRNTSDRIVFSSFLWIAALSTAFVKLIERF